MGEVQGKSFEIGVSKWAVPPPPPIFMQGFILREL
jgi:hypothetical protein